MVSVGDSSENTPNSADVGSNSSQKRSSDSESAKHAIISVSSDEVTAEAGKPSDDKEMAVHKGRGISWFIAAVIIVADMVGGGLVAMPAGFNQTGMLLGIIFMIVIAVFFTTTAHLLAQTWGIMRDRWPVYKEHCRRPYPEIGMRTFGPKMRVFTALCVYITLFGTTTVYVILSSTIFHNFLSFLGAKIPFCLLLVILSILILPITFLKSPADFWAVIGFALSCTMVAVVLIIIGISLDYSLCYPDVAYQQPGFLAVYSLGTFIFAFSGHHVFPTVQHDMYEPKEFTKSVLLGYFMCCALYMPVSVYSYAVYGQSMKDSVINSIQTDWIRYASDLAIAFHCVLTIILTINPVNQQLEDIFSVPQKFCWQRVAVRTGLLAVIMFVALSIPNFGSIMDFFGSTTIPFTCVILPTLFGIGLKAQRYNEVTGEWEIPTLKQVIERTSKKQLIWSLVINVITIICCIVSAVMAVEAMITIRFVDPCYVQWAHHVDEEDVAGDVVSCCGAFNTLNHVDPTVCPNHTLTLSSAPSSFLTMSSFGSTH